MVQVRFCPFLLGMVRKGDKKSKRKHMSGNAYVEVNMQTTDGSVFWQKHHQETTNLDSE